MWISAGAVCLYRTQDVVRATIVAVNYDDSSERVKSVNIRVGETIRVDVSPRDLMKADEASARPGGFAGGVYGSYGSVQQALQKALDATNELPKVKQTLYEMSNERNRKDDELKTMRELIERLALEYSIKSNELGNMEHEHAERVRDLERAKSDDVRRLKTQLDDREELHTKEIEEERNRIEEERNRYSRDVGEARRRLRESTENEQALTRERDELLQKCKTLTSERDAKAREATKKTHSASASSQEAANARMEKRMALEEKGQKAEELKVAKEEINQLRLQLDGAKAQLEATKNEHLRHLQTMVDSGIRDFNHIVADEVARRTASFEQREAEMQRQHEDLLRSSAQHEALAKQLERDKQELQNKVVQMSEEIKDLAKSVREGRRTSPRSQDGGTARRSRSWFALWR